MEGINLCLHQQKQLSEKFFKLLGGLRETKGCEDTTVNYIRKALSLNHNQVVRLLLEEAHVCQLKAMRIRDEGGDDKEIKKYFKEMEKCLDNAKTHIDSYGQRQWLSRYYRYRGRQLDGLKRFRQAIECYQLAIKYFPNDPEYQSYPSRIYEYQAFMVHDYFFLKGVGVGWRKSKELFLKMQREKLAMDLKRKDYFTWAVWISGIPIRAIQNVVRLRQERKHLEKIKEWIVEIEKILIFPNRKTTWGDKDFSYRRGEIEKIKRDLGISD